MPSAGFKTLHEAAIAGMDACKRTQPRERECGFGLYQDSAGDFYHTDAQSGGASGIEGMSIRIPKTAKLVALGHTHPRTDHVADIDDNSNAFSKEDLKYAKRTGLQMYMGSEKSGNVVYYKDGLTKADKHSSLGRISYGEPVGPYGLEEPTRRDQIAAAYDLHNPPAKP